ncbi:MAG: hypothetical protein ACOYKZ_03345 [Chlamydiia bacterium]
MTIKAPAASSSAFTLMPGAQRLGGALEGSSSERNAPETLAHELEQKVVQVRQGLSSNMLLDDWNDLLLYSGLFKPACKSPAPIDRASASDAPDQVMPALSQPLGLLAESPPEQPQTVSEGHLLCQREPILQQKLEPAQPSETLPLTVSNLFVMLLQLDRDANKELMMPLPSGSLRARHTQLVERHKLKAVVASWQADVQQSGPPAPIPEQKIDD